MTEHLTSDDLILRYYGDLLPLETTRVDGHLERCASCRAEWSALETELAVIGAAPPREPDQGFEARLWTQVRAGLPGARPRWTMRQLVPLTTWAALVLAASWIQATPQPETPAVAQAVAQIDARVEAHRRVLFTALDEHLAQTEILLVEMMHAPRGDTPAFAFERQAAADLVASGRLYRDTARHTGDLHVVAMLDELEGVLVDVAHGPAAPAPEDLDLWRARIDAGDLLFKVRAVTTEIRGQQARSHTEGE